MTLFHAQFISCYNCCSALEFSHHIFVSFLLTKNSENLFSKNLNLCEFEIYNSVADYLKHLPEESEDRQDINRKCNIVLFILSFIWIP